MSSRAKVLSRIGRRGFVSVLVATIAVALGATFAFAFWTTTGTGTASAATGTLNAPTVQQPTATGGTVQVSWTAPTSGVAPAGYYLTRTNTTAATTVAACNTSVGGLTTATSCSDTGVPSGTYTYAVTAVYHSWTAKGTSPSVTVNAATKLALTSSPVSGTASASASLGPITVQLQDTNGNAATSSSATTVNLSSNSAGSVVFATSANGASVTSVTIPVGSSSASFYYGDTKAGSPTITATASSLTAATQQETITAGPAKTLSASSGDHQSATVNTAFGTALRAKVVDENGNPVSGATVTFAAPSTGASGKFSDSGTASTTATTGADGMATAATLTANTVAGSYLVNATVTVSGTNTATFSLTNTAGSAKNLNTNANTTPQSATVGRSFGTALGVTVTDANGNAVSGVTVTFTAPASGASGKFTNSGTPTTTATTDNTGVATASSFMANSKAGGYTVLASVPAPGANTASFALTNNPDTASQLVFGQQPSNTQAGSSITPAVTVLIEDVSGNLTASNAAVTIGLGTNAGSGSLSGAKTINAVNGVATFSGLSIDKAASGYTLSASSGGLTGGTSTTFNVTPGVATKLAFLAQPSNTLAASPITPAVTVQVQDANGNVVTSSSASVTVSIGTNPGSGTLSGTKTVSAANGVASFSDLSIDRAGNGYTLSAAASGLTASGPSSAFNIAAAGASKLALTSSAVSGSASSTANLGPITVQLQDSSGNPTTSTAATTVNLASSSTGTAVFANASGGGAVTSVSIAAGASSATFYYGDTKRGTPTITVSSTNLTGASQQETITAGSAAQIMWVTQPPSPVAKGSLFPVGVKVVDQFNNPVPNVTVGFTLNNPNNVSGANFQQTSPSAVTDATTGIASTNVSVNKAGAFSIKATAGIVAASSNTFTAT